MRRTDHRATHPRSAAHAHDTALFVALEFSRSTWLIKFQHAGQRQDQQASSTCS